MVSLEVWDRVILLRKLKSEQGRADAYMSCVQCIRHEFFVSKVTLMYTNEHDSIKSNLIAVIIYMASYARPAMLKIS